MVAVSINKVLTCSVSLSYSKSLNYLSYVWRAQTLPLAKSPNLFWRPCMMPLLASWFGPHLTHFFVVIIFKPTLVKTAVSWHFVIFCCLSSKGAGRGHTQTSRSQRGAERLSGTQEKKSPHTDLLLILFLLVISKLSSEFVRSRVIMSST